MARAKDPAFLCRLRRAVEQGAKPVIGRKRPQRPRQQPHLRAVLDLVTLRRHRRRLGDLDPYLLRDIGVTESEAREEVERPFWDVPRHWLR